MSVKANGVLCAAEVLDFFEFCQAKNFNTEAEADAALRKGIKRLIESGATLTMQRSRLQKDDVFYATVEQAKADRYRYKVVNEYNDIKMNVVTTSLRDDECSSISTTFTPLLIIELTIPHAQTVIDCILDPTTGTVTVLDSESEEPAPNGPIPSFVQLLSQP